MKIFDYFKEVKEKINKINNYVSNPMNYEDIKNPFYSTLPKTYVWIDDENNKTNL